MNIFEEYKMAKETMPKYMFRFTYRYTLYYLLTAIAVAIVYGVLCGVFFADNERMQSYFTLAYLTLLFLITALFIIKATLVKRKFVKEKADRLAQIYEPMPFEESEEKLKSLEIVYQFGFLYSVEAYNEEKKYVKTLPFEYCDLYFLVRYWYGEIYLSVILIDNLKEEAVAACDMTPELYSFLKGKNFSFINQNVFDLFERDKRRFVRAVMRYQSKFDPTINRIDKHAK